MIFIKKGIFKIRNKKGQNVTFIPNKVQKQIFDLFEQAETARVKVRIVVIKGRQQGASAFIERLGLSCSMSMPNFSAYTIAHNQQAVRKIFQNHVKYSFDTLPTFLKKLYKVDKNNVNQIRFENEEAFNSSMEIGTSARSDTIDFLHVSEAAYISKDEAKWQELKTGSFEAANNGHIILETTARGFDNFYTFVQEILKDKFTKWKIIFLSWTDTEEYQEEPPLGDNSWIDHYESLAIKYKLEPNPIKKYGINKKQLFFYYNKAKDLKELVKAEYPFSLQEAFVSTSDSLFDVIQIMDWYDKCKQPKLRDGIEIYCEPELGHSYMIGIDPSRGEGGDESVLSVYDYHTGEQVAEAGGQYTPENMAVLAVNVAAYFNKATIACETNGNGIATMNEILKLDYPKDRIYQRYEIDPMTRKPSSSPKFGFETNKKTRPVMLSDFRGDWEEGMITINSTKLLDEMRTFVNIKGKYQGQSGCQDNRVLASMIAWQLREYIVKYA
jgi:hypothetical protein